MSAHGGRLTPNASAIWLIFAGHTEIAKIGSPIEPGQGACANVPAPYRRVPAPLAIPTIFSRAQLNHTCEQAHVRGGVPATATTLRPVPHHQAPDGSAVPDGTRVHGPTGLCPPHVARRPPHVARRQPTT